LVLALFTTLIGAVVFQPVLMGKPRVKPKPARKIRTQRTRS
jgi:hypothetical protein